MTGVVFAATAARLHASWILPSFLTFFAGLIALSWIDVERLVLPKRLVYVHLMTVGILMFAASVLTHEWRHMAVALACAVGWWFIFFVLNLINPQWLGFGDVRLSLVLGLTLGWLGYPDALLGFFAANLAGAVIGIGLIATGRIERSRRIPYGVFLSIGCAIAVFAGPSLPGPVHF